MRSPNDRNSQQRCSWDRNSVKAAVQRSVSRATFTFMLEATISYYIITVTVTWLTTLNISSPRVETESIFQVRCCHRKGTDKITSKSARTVYVKCQYIFLFEPTLHDGTWWDSKAGVAEAVVTQQGSVAFQYWPRMQLYHSTPPGERWQPRSFSG